MGAPSKPHSQRILFVLLGGFLEDPTCKAIADLALRPSLKSLKAFSQRLPEVVHNHWGKLN